MSYTGIYGPMIALDSDHAPRVVDQEQFERLQNSSDIAHVLSDQADIGEWQEDDYPRSTWDTISGFRTWEKDVFYPYNIERIAYNYSRDGFFNFWTRIGEICEPFWFAHSGESGRWPSTDRSDFEEREPSYADRVYRVEVDGGDITVYKGTVEFTGYEKAPE